MKTKIIKAGKNKYSDRSIIIEETKNELGEYHSENDEPSLSIICKRSDSETVILNRTWHKNGVLHRENGPAVDDLYGSKAWYKDGLLHNATGHAFISYRLSEWEYRHDFYVNGIPKNPFDENGPIVIHHPNDSVCSTYIYKDGTSLIRWTSQEVKDKFHDIYEKESNKCRHEIISEQERTDLFKRMGWNKQ